MPGNSCFAVVLTTTPFFEYRISITTLLYIMGRPSCSAATSLRFPPAQTAARSLCHVTEQIKTVCLQSI